MKDIEKLSSDDYSEPFNFLAFVKANKFPIIITIGFFLSTFYVAFFHHIIWTFDDGIYYLNYGRAILEGNGEDLIFMTGSIGGPVLFASLESVFHDAFAIEKMIAVLSGTGIVFVSFFVIKNVFGLKVALLSQLFIAFHPRLHFLSIQALNELVPILLILLSLFWITKKQLKNYDFMIIGSFLGLAAVFRFQSIFVLIAIIIFILVHNKKIRKNLSFCFFIIVFFLIAFSPQILYNYTTHETVLDGNPFYYVYSLSKFQTPEWREQFSDMENTGLFYTTFSDFDLFQKNYFYNLLFHSPNKLFNFNSFDNLSIFPAVPLLGLLPFIGGLVYCLKIKINRINLTILLTTLSASTSVVLLLGDIGYHSFLIIIMPIIGLTIFNIRNVNKNFLPLLILPVVFILLISIAPVHRSFHFLPMWIPLIALSAVFFIDVIPKINSKINQLILKKSQNKVRKNISFFIISIIIVILVLNSSFYCVLIVATFYGEPYDDIPNDLWNIFKIHNYSDQPSMEFKYISDILSNQPNIENSYVMANSPTYSFYTDSKFVYAQFTEGVASDTLNDYISRTNWSPIEIFLSTIHSNPSDRYNKIDPLVEYLVYNPYVYDPGSSWYEFEVANKKLDILLNPNDPRIPSNFEFLYKSDKTQIVVYKIHNTP